MRDRIDAAATALQSSRSAVIRLAIQQLLPQVEKGRIDLRQPMQPASQHN